MNLLDYFFYVLVNGQMKVFKKDEEYSIISACVLIGLWVAWLIISIIFTVGLIKPFWLSEIINANKIYHTLFLCTIGSLPAIYYSRYVHGKKYKYAIIAEKRDLMKKWIRLIDYSLFLSFIIGIPIFYGITYRLYKFGQVAWW